MRLLCMALLVAGCAAGPEENGEIPVAEGGKADCTGPRCPPDSLTPTPATIVFGAGGETVYGPLYAGATAYVHHDASRLTGDCAAVRVVGHLRGSDGVITDFKAMGDGSLVRLPSQGDHVELWFEGVSADGSCSSWDSADGANFSFPMERYRAALVHFKADWSELADAAPARGGKLAIDYDPARLTSCRAESGGSPGWGLMAKVRFDGGRIVEQPVVARVSDGPVMDRVQALFDIPQDAHEIEIWFENDDVTGCVAYDSDYGNNYRLSLE